YEQERQRVAARFDEAVRLAEQGFLSEFARLLAHLTERLGNRDNGARRVFRDSAVANLSAFFARFQHLNVRSNPELDALVEQAQQLVRGITPRDLRDHAGLRQQIATQLSGVQSVLDGLLVQPPRRRLLRSVPAPKGDNHATGD